MVGFVIVLLLYSVNAHAYLDPGTGSILLQAVLAGVAGLLAVFKIYWSKITAWMKRGSQRKTDNGADKQHKN